MDYCCSLSSILHLCDREQAWLRHLLCQHWRLELQQSLGQLSGSVKACSNQADAANPELRACQSPSRLITGDSDELKVPMAPDFPLKPTSDEARDIPYDVQCLLYRHKDLTSGLDPHKKYGRARCHASVIPALGRWRQVDPGPRYLATSKLWRNPVSENKGEARAIVQCARALTIQAGELLKSSELP